MLKIATHDSATGEKGNWWSWLFLPFAKTQQKTLKEQYESGCRLFDIRIRKVFGVWKCAHGPWVTRRSAISIFEELNSYSDCKVTITYEGGSSRNEEFLEFVKKIKETFTNLKYGGIAVKFGELHVGVRIKYNYLIPADPGWLDAPSQSKFIALDGRSWHTLIPIPWLWKNIYYPHPVFSENIYTYVDFL